MTITIVAIVVGIGVDDCIHYLHDSETRLLWIVIIGAGVACHGSIGRAMYYTTLTVVVGFATLTLFNFTPSLLGADRRAIAAVAGALLLLPKLILMFRPFGPGAD